MRALQKGGQKEGQGLLEAVRHQGCVPEAAFVSYLCEVNGSGPSCSPRCDELEPLKL